MTGTRRRALWRLVRRLRRRRGLLLLGAAVLACVALGYHLTRQRGRRGPALPVGPVPGVRLAGPVRVLLVRAAAEAQVGVQGEFEVRRVPDGQSLNRLSWPGDTAVRATPTGLLIGRDLYPDSALDLVPARMSRSTLSQGAGGGEGDGGASRSGPGEPVWDWGTEGVVRVNGRRYRGCLRLVREGDAALHVINVVPLEPYLAGVIHGEMPSYWPVEALKAQAVAARTYALFQLLGRSETALYDLRADESSQVYLGVEGETRRSRSVVAETAGIVLTHLGRLFSTYYSSTCGGHTHDVREVFGEPTIPPLAGVPCPYCAGTKFARWERTVSLATLTEGLNAYLREQGGPVGEVQAVSVAAAGPTGHVGRVRVVGSLGTAELSGTAFRRALPTPRLLSSCFRVTAADGSVRIEGVGYGHGVGLCQVGARYAAEAGLDFLGILQYYYPLSSAARVPANANAQCVVRRGP